MLNVTAAASNNYCSLKSQIYRCNFEKSLQHRMTSLQLQMIYCSLSLKPIAAASSSFKHLLQPQTSATIRTAERSAPYALQLQTASNTYCSLKLIAATSNL